MDNEKKQKEEDRRERVGYGVKIPAIPLEEAVRIIKEVSRVGGLEGSIDALSKVTGNSASSSTFTYKIRTLKAFGLLSVQDSTYALTDIGKHIAQPESLEQEAQAVVDAFSKQDLLNRVWENYKGKILPQREYLANHFEKIHEIPGTLKDSWADYFVAAAKFAGLLHERDGGSLQVLLSPAINTSAEIAPRSAERPATSPVTKPFEGKPQCLPVSLDHTDWGILTQRRISGDRKAIFAIPDELTQEDIDVLKMILKGIEAGLDGLKRFETRR